MVSSLSCWVADTLKQEETPAMTHTANTDSSEEPEWVTSYPVQAVLHLEHHHFIWVFRRKDLWKIFLQLTPHDYIDWIQLLQLSRWVTSFDYSWERSWNEIRLNIQSEYQRAQAATCHLNWEWSMFWKQKLMGCSRSFCQSEQSLTFPLARQGGPCFTDPSLGSR